MPPSIRAVLILLCMEPLFTVLAQDDEGNVQSITELPYTTDLTSERGLSLCGMTAYNYEGNCCFSIGPKTNYDGAREKCMIYKGHLVKLEPPEIYTRLQELYSPDQIPDSWIGLAEDTNNADVYIWDLDSTEVVTTNWDINEPNMNDPNLFCVYVDGSTGKWKTATCDELFDAICCVPEEVFDEDTADIETTVPVATTDDTADYDTTVSVVTTEEPVSRDVVTTVDSVTTKRDDTTVAREDTTVEEEDTTVGGTVGTTDIPKTEPPEDCFKIFGCVGDYVDCYEDEGCVCHEGYVFIDAEQTECGDLSPPLNCFEEFGCVGDYVDCNEDEGCICHEGYVFIDEEQTECGEVSPSSPPSDDCRLRHGCEGENIDCFSEQGCVCHAGYEFTDGTRTECRDIDECTSGLHDCRIPRNYVCVNEDGGFSCVCQDGYTVDPTGGTCVLIGECTPEDDTCDEPMERCTNHNGAFVCSCAPGLQKNPLTLVCQNINECESSSSDPCAFLTHTQCVDLIPGQSNALFRCDCKENFIPDPARPGHCMRAPDEVLCQQLNCQNGGTCFVDVLTDDNVEMSCSCTDDFEGETCGTPRNLEQGTPEELSQGLMIGAIATAAALLALLVSCCCLCACLPFCSPPKPPPPPPPRPLARPWAVRRPYVMHRDTEHWFLEQRYDEEALEAYDVPVEEVREVWRPVEEERQEWHLERAEREDEQRMGFFRRAMDRAARNPLSAHSNLGYQQAEGRGSDRSEMAVPFMADGSINA